MTTSELSINHPKEIIDNYLSNGFNNIFLRPLNPYGLALNNTNWETYFDKFIEFYKSALNYIIDINIQDRFFVEEFTYYVKYLLLLQQVLLIYNLPPESSTALLFIITMVMYMHLMNQGC